MARHSELTFIFWIRLVSRLARHCVMHDDAANITQLLIAWLEIRQFPRQTFKWERQKKYSFFLIVCISISESQRNACRNIQRLYTASFKRFTVYGLFVIDVNFPIHLVAVISVYTIAQLQLILPQDE